MLINTAYSFLPKNEITQKAKTLNLPSLPEGKSHSAYYNFAVSQAFKTYNYNISFCSSKMNDPIPYCLDFTDEQNTKYLELKSKYPNLSIMELGLIAKFDLSDTKIQKYLKMAPYKDKEGNEIPNEELMLCIKRGFDENKIAQYCELRNATINLKEYTVREKGGKQKYPIGYAINAIEQNRTYENIKNDINFYKIMQKYNLEIAIDYVTYENDEQANAFLEAIDKNIHFTIAHKYAELKPEQRKIFWEAEEKNIGGANAIEYATLNPKQRKAFWEARNKNFGDSIFTQSGLRIVDALQYAKLEPEQREAFWEITQSPLLRGYEFNYARLKPKQRVIFNMVVNECGLDCFSAIGCAQLDPKKRLDYLNSVKSGGIDQYIAFGYVELEPEQKEAFWKGFKKDIDGMVSLKYAKLNPEQRKAFKKCIKKGMEEIVAYDYAKLEPEKRKAFWEGLKHNFDFFSALEYAKLNPEQRELFWLGFINGLDIDLALQYTKLKQKQRNYFWEGVANGLGGFSINYANMKPLQRETILNGISNNINKNFLIAYQKLRNEQREAYLEGLDELSLEEYQTLKYATLKPSQRERAKKLMEQGATWQQAYAIAKYTDVSSIDLKQLEQIPDNVWYIAETGAGKEAHEIIRNTIIQLMKTFESPLLPENIKTEEIDDLIPLNYSYDEENSNLSSNDNSLSLKLQKLMVMGKPALIIHDNNSKNEDNNCFVALNGAIAHVGYPFELNKNGEKELESHCNLIKEKQAPILASAIREFVFDVTDKNGNCIISKGVQDIEGSKDFIGSTANDDNTKAHYINTFNKLKQNDQFNAENILRLFPKDAILSINPYSIKNNTVNMLYSISAEWKSQDGTKWEMRIHSQDLSLSDDISSNWNVRLGYKKKGRRKINYLLFDDNNKSFLFDETKNTTKDKSAHIKMESPVDNNLLNNTDFQRLIRNISSKLYSKYNVDAICEEYGLQVEAGSSIKKVAQKIRAVIEDAMKNPAHYYEHKGAIDRYRENLGLLDLAHCDSLDF